MAIDKNKYKNLLCRVESNCNYKIINSIGALGKYQFTLSTLNALKNKYNLPAFINSTNFINRPDLQELYFDYLVFDSLNFIANNNLDQYKGRQVTGTMKYKNVQAPLNTYGMLAAIHLAGATALKNFLENGYNPNDGNASLSDYAAYFSKNLIESDLTGLKEILLAIIPGIVLYYI
ncbi:MAG: hypothetical protein IPM51_12105 [Sphingobacteriaceae bacterium]|nr:hypothetical protein [Sphingobacteriaceae bacterium]